MLRFSEVFALLPILVLVWVRLRTGAMPTGRLLAAIVLGMVAAGAGMAWYGDARSLQGGAYVPARMQDGHIVAGHGAGAPPPAQ